jgi:hypothetical protein
MFFYTVFQTGTGSVAYSDLCTMVSAINAAEGDGGPVSNKNREI